MAFKKHKEFFPPESPDSRIWRYMDLAKFLSLLDKSCLYFARLDTFSEFDPFEGYYTSRNLDIENVKFDQIPKESRELLGIKDEEFFNGMIRAEKNTRHLVKKMRTITYVNSWHIKEHESAAMWKIYLNSNEGIAIQSTYKRLIDALSSYNDFDIFIGKIKYIDYEKELIPKANILSPYMYKRKSFEYEDELRALIWTKQHGKNPEGISFISQYGLYIPINLQLLIDKIYVAPNAPSWILEIINSVTIKFGLNKEVKQSNLALTPIY